MTSSSVIIIIMTIIAIMDNDTCFLRADCVDRICILVEFMLPRSELKSFLDYKSDWAKSPRKQILVFKRYKIYSLRIVCVWATFVNNITDLFVFRETKFLSFLNWSNLSNGSSPGPIRLQPGGWSHIKNVPDRGWLPPKESCGRKGCSCQEMGNRKTPKLLHRDSQGKCCWG